MNELKRLKVLKRKQVEDICKKVVAVAGCADANDQSSPFHTVLAKGIDDAEFDGTQWDDMMNKVFNDQYYEAADDAKKPELSSESEFDGEDFADDLPATTVGWQSRGAAEPSTAGDNKATRKLKKLLAEYDMLNYEDIKGGFKTRFRYQKVAGDTFGLDVEDMLAADDELLNEYVSLKKLAPYRQDDRHKRWQKKFTKQIPIKRKQFKRKLKQLRRAQVNDIPVAGSDEKG